MGLPAAPNAEDESMKVLPAILACLGLLLIVGMGPAADVEKAEKGVKSRDTRVFELRTYHAAPGKMEALNARFRDHTNKLFEKHGMTIIGFWNPAEADKADKTLVYILAYPSMESAY